MTPVGFEPTQLALVELESTPLDHSGKLSCQLDITKYTGTKRLCICVRVHQGSAGIAVRLFVVRTGLHTMRIGVFVCVCVFVCLCGCPLALDIVNARSHASQACRLRCQR